MPPSKGLLERGYTLQAQEQGTGTTPCRHGDSQGTPSLSLREGEEGDWGKLLRARSCGQHSRAPLVLGEPPEEARHPLSTGKESALVGLWMLQCAQRGGLPGTTPGASRRGPPPAATAWRALEPSECLMLFLRFMGKAVFAQTVLYLLLPPCGWKLLSHQARAWSSLPFSPRCHCPGDYALIFSLPRGLGYCTSTGDAAR